MKEADVTSEIINRLRRFDGPSKWVCKFNDRITYGIPDFCVVVDGKTTWFEMKTETSVSPIQKHNFDRIKNVWVITWDLKTREWQMQKWCEVKTLTGTGYDDLVQDIWMVASSQL